jgi:hypothetical protein
MTDPLPIRDFLAVTLIAFALTLRIGLIIAGRHQMRASRSLKDR